METKFAVVALPPHPTGPDVDRVIEAIGIVPEGTTVRHEQIEAALGIRHGCHRYWTVVGAWRRRMLKTHNVDMRGVPGIGYKALNPQERVRHGEDEHRYGLKRVKTGTKIVATTDRARLAEADQARYDHAVLRGGLLLTVAKQARKEVEAAKAKALNA